MNDFWGVVSLCFVVSFITWMFTEPPIYPASLEYANKVCAENNGWEYIEEGYNVFATVHCNNGAEFNYNPDKLKDNE